MGIFCQINLCKPVDGWYIYQPGTIISGAIRYCTDEEYQFTSITVSLRGRGHLHLIDKDDSDKEYTNDEIYVDINDVIYTNEKGEPHPVGQQETQFSFLLPPNIPGTMKYKKKTSKYHVKCYVKYVLRIKFERPWFFRLNKQYEKEINVYSVQTPRLTTEPLVYGDQKTLFQLNSLFSSKKGIVNVKAVMKNSVFIPGEYVQIDFELTNLANKTVKGVQLKISEVDQYTTMGGRVFKTYTDVENAEYRYDSLPGGKFGTFTVDLKVPEHCVSIDHCKLLSRDYSVMVVVILPDLHKNLPLEVPFQVIKTISSSFEEGYYLAGDAPSDDPPSYWEAMTEESDDFAESKGSKVDEGDVLFKLGNENFFYSCKQAKDMC